MYSKFEHSNDNKIVVRDCFHERSKFELGGNHKKQRVCRRSPSSRHGRRLRSGVTSYSQEQERPSTVQEPSGVHPPRHPRQFSRLGARRSQQILA